MYQLIALTRSRNLMVMCSLDRFSLYNTPWIRVRIFSRQRQYQIISGQLSSKNFNHITNAPGEYGCVREGSKSSREGLEGGISNLRFWNYNIWYRDGLYFKLARVVSSGHVHQAAPRVMHSLVVVPAAGVVGQPIPKPYVLALQRFN